MQRQSILQYIVLISFFCDYVPINLIFLFHIFPAQQYMGIVCLITVVET